MATVNSALILVLEGNAAITMLNSGTAVVVASRHAKMVMLVKEACASKRSVLIASLAIFAARKRVTFVFTLATAILIQNPEQPLAALPIPIASRVLPLVAAAHV